MAFKWKRLSLAAAISSSCFGVTYSWYKMTEKKMTQQKNEKPLAYIGKIQDEIHRRPAKRLLWQAVDQGEPLYNGEAVRTGSTSEVRIQFPGSDRYLDLDSDSLIVLQQANGEIALDLMEGSLYVNAKGGLQDQTLPGLILNSPKGKIDISAATVSMSKSKTSAVQFQVLDGSAKIRNNSGGSKELTKGKLTQTGETLGNFDPSNLKIIHPLLDKPIYMDPDKATTTLFKWEGFPAKTRTSLWLGPTRKTMVPIAHTTNTIESQINTTVRIGKYFWKLVATDNITSKPVGESATYRVEVISKYAPTMIQPLADSIIPMDKGPVDLIFKWQNVSDSAKVILEVAKDPALKMRVLNQKLENEDTLTLHNLDAGTYFWRTSAIYPEEPRPIAGTIQKFTIAKKEFKPEPLPIAAVAPLTPLSVLITNPQEQKIQYYLYKPQLELAWSADKPANVASWKVTYYEANSLPETAKEVSLKETKTATPVEKPGRYVASVEAIDKEGHVLGISAQRTISIAPLPLIKTPKLFSENGIIRASSEGNTQISWEKIEGAKEYQLILNDKTGRSRTLNYTNNQIALKNLMPGEYQVKIIAVDKYGRSSEGSSSGKFTVPEKNALKAPTLKSKKVRTDED